MLSAPTTGAWLFRLASTKGMVGEIVGCSIRCSLIAAQCSIVGQLTRRGPAPPSTIWLGSALGRWLAWGLAPQYMSEGLEARTDSMTADILQWSSWRWTWLPSDCV
eukprot:256777-Amphidinium_carterae.1